MPDFSVFLGASAWISLLTLTAMEVVLGIDNIVFITILTGKLPEEQQQRIRSIGIALALIMRLGLLFAISWVMGLTSALFSIAGQEFSGRDLILLFGGLFLVAKATHEIFDKLEREDDHATRAPTSVGMTLAQIVVLDIVFSLDSVITAVGMASDVSVMIVAMVIAVGVMLVFAGGIGRFVHRHPSMKILALSFLILIGVMLVGEGLGQHVNKAYIYFAMAFALAVELVEMKILKRKSPVKLHEHAPPGVPKAEGAAD